MAKTVTLHVQQIPTETHAMFRARCVRNYRGMREVIIELMRETLQGKHNGAVKRESTLPTTGWSALFIREIPKRLHADFKFWCTERGLRIRDQVEFLMRKTIKRQPNDVRGNSKSA